MRIDDGVSAVGRWKIGVYGESGTGKSWLASTAPDPFVIFTEAQGITALADACAARGIPMPPHVLCDSIAKLHATIAALHAPDPIATLIRKARAKTMDESGLVAAIEALPYQAPQTVVSDSLTEIAEMVRDELDHDAPPKISEKDKLPVDDIRRITIYKQRVSRLMRALRDLPFHVVLLARLDEREIKDNKTGETDRIFRPSLGANLGSQFSAVCNVVGISRREILATKDETSGDIVQTPRWGVQFLAEDYKLSKTHRSLRVIEPSNVAGWLARMNGEPETKNGKRRGKKAAAANDDTNSSDDTAPKEA